MDGNRYLGIDMYWSIIDFPLGKQYGYEWEYSTPIECAAVWKYHASLRSGLNIEHMVAVAHNYYQVVPENFVFGFLIHSIHVHVH